MHKPWPHTQRLCAPGRAGTRPRALATLSTPPSTRRPALSSAAPKPRLAGLGKPPPPATMRSAHSTAQRA
eukprot:7588755-Lingulodinium_polyedra.AAC.1